MEEFDNHVEIKQQRRGNPFWVKGVSGNPKGRPKGKTLKEYAREYLACMTPEEKDEFMEGLPKELIWRMGEGNPESKIDAKVTNENQFTVEQLEAAKETIIERLNTRTNKGTIVSGSGDATAE